MELLYVLVLSLMCWNGCESESIKPALYYEAAFDPAMVDEAEAFMKETCEKWGFELYEWDRESMKSVTFGQEDFDMVFYTGEELNMDQYILDITNIGTVLRLALYENENVSRSELERLSQEVRDGLTTKLGINFKVAEP